MTQTIVRQSHATGAATIVLGDVLSVIPHTTWHSGDMQFDLTFEHGTGKITAQALLRLMLKAREALIRAHITEGLNQ